MQYSQTLARYYIKWFQDCHDSAIYCRERGNEAEAQKYLDSAREYLTIIMENWEGITAKCGFCQGVCNGSHYISSSSHGY